jgi:4-diphosphocytidyl-2-C-methyl-D-erythritol kinase
VRGEALTPAKINWDLRVLGRRADGFHELRSWFVPLALCDALRAEPAPDGASSLHLSGPDAVGVPSDASNLVLRAERAWREAFPARSARVAPLRWTLAKRIPHGAGLGGGSANAAGALALLERFAGAEGAAPERLHAVAAALGSDVPFFLMHEGGAEWRGGRGELLLARAPFPTRRVVIAMPPFRLATPAVYAALGAPTWSGDAPPPPAAPSATPGPNELAAAARRVAPQLDAWTAEVFGTLPHTMCGSGSAHFCVPASAVERRGWLEGAPHRHCATLIETATLPGPALRIRMES